MRVVFTSYESFPFDEVVKLFFSVIEQDGKNSQRDWQRILSREADQILKSDKMIIRTKVRIKGWPLR